jgi:hypothetical protein
MPDAWLDAFFAWLYRRQPVSATFIGVHDYDDQLPDLSAPGRAALADGAAELLSRLPPEPRSLDRQLADGYLRIQRWEAASHHFNGNPVHFTGEAIFGLVSLLLRDFAPLAERLESARARLDAVPAFLQVGAQRITSAPAAWLERARHECAGAHLLLEDVAAEYPQLADAARVADDAFTRFDTFLTGVVSTDQYASGAEALNLLLRHAHFSELDSDGVERLALDRIAEEEAFLAATSAPDEPRVEVPANFRSATLTSDESPPEDSVHYLSRFQTTWESACQLARDRDLLSVPEWPVRFVERPRWARRAAPYLYFLPYRSPAPLDPPEVVDYLVPPSSDDSTIKLNHVVHHASLGHHFQNWYAARGESRIGQIAAADCASRIAMLCGGTMAEGWANYAVDLADEFGFLSPAESYGQHRARVRMAARAVVDIRLHQGRFSLDEAIAFYASRVGMTPAAAQGEAVKNSLFPGAACMYLMGWDGIWRLRRQFQSLSGSRFSLREFHDRVLSFGSVPVSLIARAMLETPTLATPR